MRLYPRWPVHTETAASYGGVLVPLDEAHLHSHSARCGRTEYEEPPSAGDHDDIGNNDDDDDYDDDGDHDDNGDHDDQDERDKGDGIVRSKRRRRGRGETEGMLEMRAAEYSIAGLRREVRRGGGTSEYEIKSKLINKAVQDIGMGRYNWQLFFLCGFGWFADNLWMQGVSLILPSLSAEFAISEKTVRYTTSSIFLGLCVGSFGWGVGSDVMGRRVAFNATLLITAVFGILASYAPSWGWLCVLLAALGSGVGGNLPVDGALFLEFLPDASSSLLTLLSVWWPVGQLCSSLFAWFFMANWPVDQGWRWFVFAIGLVTLLMFAVRFFVFDLFESPKFLLSKGRQAEAVAVVHGIAYRNGARTWLTEKILDQVAAEEGYDANEEDGYDYSYNHGNGNAENMESNNRHHHNQHQAAATTTTTPRRARTAPAPVTASAALRNKLATLSGQRLRPLFADKQLGIATAIMWFVWATIGMGYPLFNAFLPQYLSRDSGAAAAPGPDDAPPAAIPAETYRNYAITSVAGVPGSLLAAYAVDHPSPLLGRRGTLAASTAVSAAFLFAFAALAASPAARLALSCVEAFAQNIMYGVLYAFTPEIFPAPVRGAGTGVASFLNRVAGLMAPLLAANVPGDGATVPIYLSAVLILAAFVAMCLIPIETRGRQRL